MTEKVSKNILLSTLEEKRGVLRNKIRKVQKIAQNLNQRIQEVDSQIYQLEVSKFEQDPNPIYVYNCKFTTRTKNSLLGEKIETIRELIEHSEYDLYIIPGFGNISMEDVRKVLREMGVSLKK